MAERRYPVVEGVTTTVKVIVVRVFSFVIVTSVLPSARGESPGLV